MRCAKQSLSFGILADDLEVLEHELFESFEIDATGCCIWNRVELLFVDVRFQRATIALGDCFVILLDHACSSCSAASNRATSTGSPKYSTKLLADSYRRIEC